MKRKTILLSMHVFHHMLITNDKITEQLKSENMYELFETIEMPLIFVLFDMQQQGISVDKKALVDYSKVLGTKILVLEKEI